MIINSDLQLSGMNYKLKDIPFEETYSTNEIKTNKIWLGKPVYRKLIDMGTIQNNSTKEVNHNIQNIDKIINYWAISNATTGQVRKIPFVSGSNVDNIRLDCSYTSCRLITYGTWSGYTYTYFVIEYTKTTD